MTSTENKGRLSIAFVIRDITAIGGAQLNALRLANEIHKCGYKVVLIGQGSAQEIRKHISTIGLNKSIPIVPVSSPKGFFYRLVRRYPNIYFWIPCMVTLWKIRHQFDILHCPLLMDSIIVCALVEYFIGKPCVIKIGSAGKYGDIKRAQQNKLSWLIRLILKKITMIVCLTQEIENELIRAFNIPKNKIHRIPNGIDHRIYSDILKENIYKFRKEIGVGKNDRLVVFVGRLEKKKRVDFLIQAWRPVYEEFSGSAYLLIIGDGALRGELEQQCVKTGIKSSVIFYGRSNEIPTILNASDIFVLPSISEGFANVLLEAMSASLPIIATNTKGNMEILNNKTDSLLFEENDTRDLSEKILYFLRDQEVCKQYGIESYNRVIKEFQINRITQQYLNLYKNILQ